MLLRNHVNYEIAFDYRVSVKLSDELNIYTNYCERSKYG